MLRIHPIQHDIYVWLAQVVLFVIFFSNGSPHLRKIANLTDIFSTGWLKPPTSLTAKALEKRLELEDNPFLLGPGTFSGANCQTFMGLMKSSSFILWLVNLSPHNITLSSEIAHFHCWPLFRETDEFS